MPRQGFTAKERAILREALCQNGNPQYINESNLEPAKEKFPRFAELYASLVKRKGGSKSKANNTLRKCLVKKAGKVILKKKNSKKKSK